MRIVSRRIWIAFACLLLLVYNSQCSFAVADDTATSARNADANDADADTDADADADVNHMNSSARTGTRTCSSDGSTESDPNTCIASDSDSDAETDTEIIPNNSNDDSMPSNYKFPGCRLYLAKSTIQPVPVPVPASLPALTSANSHRLGLFTAEPLKRGQPIAAPDILIPLTDYQSSMNDIGSILSSLSNNPQPYGAQHEAKSVAAILPGVPALAATVSVKSDADAKSKTILGNAMPFGRDVDEANVPRTTSPGAGGFTHYHNITFYARKPLEAGSEIFIGLDTDREQEVYQWYNNRGWTPASGEHHKLEKDHKNDDQLHKRDVKDLQQNGVCVDNLKPHKSRIKNAGRGAYTTRFIPRGSIVSISPLVPIDRNSTITKRIKYNNKVRKGRKQLLVNYCLGHVNSSLMFYPTAPVVNLINHAHDVNANANAAGGNGKYTSNVRLRWSSRFDSHFNNDNDEMVATTGMTMEEIKSHPNRPVLLMEYIATRDIQPNEEILLNYGQPWIDAWQQHEIAWKPLPNAQQYTPSYVMDDVAGLLRTEKEQVNHGYPANVMTACFYRYSTVAAASRKTGTGGSLSSATALKWKMDRYTFDYSSLRPCSIMQREQEHTGQVVDGKPQAHVTYTAMMKNYPGIRKEERIPKGEIHVVESIPRNAIRFVDKMYSTDMHLDNAFRHEIQIPDDIFPQQWMDLL